MAPRPNRGRRVLAEPILLCGIMRRQIGQVKEPGDLAGPQMEQPIVPEGLVELQMVQPAVAEDLEMPVVVGGLAAAAWDVADAKI